MLDKISIFLEMIKFKLTIFALPFAFMGAWLGADGVPKLDIFLWVILAMVGARTCAMGFNRLVDVKFDRANPRTAERALPAGTIKMVEAWIFIIVSGLLFFLACYMLNALTMQLAPVALALTLFYSYTKRFTWLCHVVLGMALAFSPLGGFVAVTGSLHGYPWMLSLAVLFWVTGFDIVYACLDAEFDREAGLNSMPARFGRKRSFRIAQGLHVLAFCLFAYTGVYCDLGTYYFLGILSAGCALFYQHYIVNPDDLSHIQVSFFTMNGMISVSLFAATWLALMFR
ncbi:MAG: putative 4-hydroxybenzoate polyprenyltransferase [Desulfobulbaceae bacterium]|jgi:4-hydroxybenzoate polyprenyltransferase|nr:putative 4-hydroxybenzoate polyprenyltransferase [Desulfobulbaceae bacterium]